jgi:signal transduction histidine kinase
MVSSEYLPRVRIEWLLASCRVLLAAGALLAVVVRPVAAGQSATLLYGFGWFLLYSLIVLALVWTPVRFAAGWGLALHAFDLAAFAIFTLLAESPSSPILAYFTFLAIGGTLRWQVSGVMWTALAAFVVYGVANLYLSYGLGLRPFAIDAFLIRGIHFGVIAGLIAYLGAHHNRFLNEMGRLVSWPRRIPRDLRELVDEVIAECSNILRAPRILIVWEDPDEGAVNLAWGPATEVQWASEPEATYGSFVVAGLEHRSFQAADVTDERGQVVHWSAEAFRQRACAPVNAALQARFDMRRVQSWSLDGELIRGRIFALDKEHLRLDDLVFGEVVARLVVSRLDGLYLLRRLRHAAALQERLRVARDLHDSLLQSAAGTALQLLAARRLLDRDPVSARQRLDDVQNQIEQDELDMREFIRRLRPANPLIAQPPAVLLPDRLEALRDRVERQWEVRVRIIAPAAAPRWPEPLADDVYRIVQEAVLNAARHADASVIMVEYGVAADRLALRITDDGKGFPFQGTFDLDALHALDKGPLTLKERVAERRGRLQLTSSDTGTELSISLPLAPDMR